jgi:CRP-like cAMP-binding protein
MHQLAEVRPIVGRNERRAVLLQHPLFGTLGAQIIDRLLANAIIKKVRRGAVIFAKGDPGSSLFGVCSGAVKICVPSVAGRDAIFSILRRGEILGEIALLDGRERTADAIALTDCELLMIERRNFVPLILSHPEVGLKIMEVLCARLRRTSEQVQDVMFLDLPSRLAKTLLRLHDAAVAAASSPAPRRVIRITQRELGQMIGMSRESTNKQLRTWQAQHLVRLERGGIAVLNADALATLAGPNDYDSLQAQAC